MYEDEIREALGLDADRPVDDANVYEGKLTDYASELADDMGWLAAMEKAGITDGYFDSEQFAFDLMVGGDVVPLHKVGENRRDEVNRPGGVWLVNPYDFY